MAINTKLDLVGNLEPPTIILANRSGNKLGQLDVNVKSIDLSDKLNDASELSFTINKYVDGKLTNLWDKIVDFKLVYCKEWDTWFEIKVELDEATETVKTVFCTQLGQAELSQIILYNIEINTEEDISRDDYKISILYDESDPKASILNRVLEKAPHYRIKYVDSTIARIQRSFPFDGVSIVDALNDIEEEIGCLVIYDSNSDENGMPDRAVSVYDLQQNCNDCGYRGEFTDECPKCGSKNIKYGYGEDTSIFVTSDELATEGIQLVTDTDSVKNCFKLEAGDDLMTATIRNCNPNGTDYIWYFSDSVKEDMSEELVKKIEDYDNEYKNYYNNNVSNIDESLLNNYNSLVEKYRDFYNTPSTCLNCDYEGNFDTECPQCGSGNILAGKSLQTISTPIIGYSALMNAYYNAIDLSLYLKSGLMPSVEMSDTNAEEQAKLLTASSLSPVAVANIDTISLATANSAVLAMAKIIVKSTFKVQVNSSELSADKKTWTGNFVITNYSDDEDMAVSEIISVEINGDNETFIKQKIEKALNKEDTDDYSISGLLEKEYDDFCNELKKYALNPLISFRDACQACIDILMEQGVGDDTTSDLYKNLYAPYYNKLMAIESEIKIREDEINLIVGVYDNEGNLITEGLQTDIERCKIQIQNALNFESYLGEKLWLEFCTYRREDKYSNSNYISDGLNNAELFEKALEFIEVAKNEIYKSSELQHSISTTLNNLLVIPKFKSLVKYFKNGNWIRVQVDDKVHKLRLLEYNIGYGDIENIPVEFSDVTKIKNGVTDVEDILSQASSMATSYDAVKRQSKQGDVAQDTIEQWLADGLSNSLVQIQNNDNEEITITKNGLLGRSYSDITGTYSPKQIKLTHNILAYTDNNWESVKLAIGEHNYVAYDKDNGEFTEETGYGISADFVTAGIVSGSQIIGGDIYSNNYSNIKDEEAGSYLNLSDGTFSFAGGKLTYDGDHLSVDGEITVATSGTIGCWNVNNSSIYKGSEIFGNSEGMYFGTEGLSISDTFEVTSSGVATMTGANITGVINAEKGGTIAGFNIGDTAIYNNTESLTSENSGVYIGIDGIRQYSSEDANVTISNGVLNANGANITGEITATSGSFTNGTFDDCTIDRCTMENCTINNTCTISGELSGATGTFSGTVSASTIEGSTIKGSSIEGGSLSIGNDESGYYAWISEDGVLNAGGANISGTINAVNGNIGGWNITSDALYKSIYSVSSGMCSIYKPNTEGLEYTLSDDGTYYIVSGIGTCTDADIVIPSTYNNKPVSSIGENAFSENEKIISVSIPNSVTTIDDAAFFYCSSLTNIAIPDSVTSIGTYAFFGSALTNITIPDSVTSIGYCAFLDCGSLASIIISDSVISMGYYAFYNCANNAEFYCKAKSQPKGWDNDWTNSLNIMWGYSNNSYDSLVAHGATSCPRFFAGSNSNIPVSINDAKFLVLEDGSLYAKAAEIAGTINASDGNIGGLKIDNGIKGYANNGESFSLTTDGLTINSSSAGIQVGNFQTFYDSDSDSTYWQANGALYIQGLESGEPITSIELMTEQGDTTIEATTSLYAHSSGNECFVRISESSSLYYPVAYTIYYQQQTTLGFWQSEKSVTVYSKNDGVGIHLNNGTNRIRFSTSLDGLKSATSYRYGDLESEQKIFDIETITQTAAKNDVVLMGNLIPKSPDAYSLGREGEAWKSIYGQNIYSETGQVSQSDRNKKNTISSLSAEYEMIFDSIIPVKYKFNKNSSDRTHIGFIAQDVKDAIISSGLTTKDFAGYCEWVNDDGTISCGLRYEEFIALCVSEIQKLKKRVIELEENLKS